MIKYKYPYLISAKERGIFWVFNGETHKKKILNLKNIENLKELIFHSSACQIVRFKGRGTSLDHVSIMTDDENDFEYSSSKYCTKYAWVIYHDEFERLSEYFKENNLRTRMPWD